MQGPIKKEIADRVAANPVFLRTRLPRPKEAADVYARNVADSKVKVDEINNAIATLQGLAQAG